MSIPARGFLAPPATPPHACVCGAKNSLQSANLEAPEGCFRAGSRGWIPCPWPVNSYLCMFCGAFAWGTYTPWKVQGDPPPKPRGQLQGTIQAVIALGLRLFREGGLLSSPNVPPE